MGKKEPAKIPEAEARKIIARKIRGLYKIGYSYDEISDMLWVSKSTISYAIKGRAKKQVEPIIKK